MNQRTSIRKAQSKGKKLETKVLEEQTRRMEEKLQELKKQMEFQKSNRDQKSQTGSRWKQSQSNVPLRGYATKVIEDQKTLFKKHGITPMMMATKISTGSYVKDPKSQTKTSIYLVTAPTEKTEEAPVVEYDLASKFGKAKVKVQKVITQDSVTKLLESIGLPQYIEIFQRNHIYDIELINKDVLEEIGISPGHKIKILKKVNQSKGQPDNQPANSLKEKQQIKNQQPDNQGDEQDNDFLQIGQQEIREGTSSIYQGEYDEEKNARQFQQAVLAFRNVRKQIQQIQIALQTDQIKPNTYLTQPPSTTKYACFGCYKSFVNLPFSLNSRTFCSQICLNKYKISIEDKCPKCQKVFNKLEGFAHNGIRYCRIECSPEVKNMEEYFIKWKMEERNKQTN